MSPFPRASYIRLTALAPAGWVAFALWAGTGCSMVPLNSSLPAVATDAEAEGTTVAPATCAVEMRSRLRRGATVEVPLSEDTRVQDVLDASRATSKFRHLDVAILRPTPNASEPVLKLACRFDGKTRRIGWESDYAVLPGDRVLVREDTSEGLDKVIGSALGPVLGGR